MSLSAISIHRWNESTDITLFAKVLQYCIQFLFLLLLFCNFSFLLSPGLINHWQMRCKSKQKTKLHSYSIFTASSLFLVNWMLKFNLKIHSWTILQDWMCIAENDNFFFLLILFWFQFMNVYCTFSIWMHSVFIVKNLYRNKLCSSPNWKFQKYLNSWGEMREKLANAYWLNTVRKVGTQNWPSQNSFVQAETNNNEEELLAVHKQNYDFHINI